MAYLVAEDEATADAVLALAQRRLSNGPSAVAALKAAARAAD